MNTATTFLVLMLGGIVLMVVGLFWMIFGSWKKAWQIVLRLLLVLAGAAMWLSAVCGIKV